ncbi:hypothetical protein BH09PLA1_BH09PLA1_27440 [soil metagenome]
MQIRFAGISCACAVVAGLIVSRASAQLVVGSTTTTTSNPAAVYIDLTTGVQTTLWNSVANKKVNGAAADLAGGRLYTNDAARLNFWEFGSIGTAPTAIAGMYRTVDGSGTFAATGVDGLAWANDKLYGATSFGSTVFKRGIYEVSTVSDGMPTPHCVMTQIWTDPTAAPLGNSGSLSLSGLDFDPATNLFYTTQTTDASAVTNGVGRGLYSIDAFGSGAITKITDFPAGRTNVDGLAVGGGKYWLTEEIPGTGLLIYPYNPATSSYEATITVPFAAEGSQRTAGATWAPGALFAVPEPTGLALIGLVALAGIRRRRS